MSVNVPPQINTTSVTSDSSVGCLHDTPTRTRHGAISPTLSPLVMPYVSATPPPLTASRHKEALKRHADAYSMNDIDLDASSEEIENHKKNKQLRKKGSLRHIARTMSRDNLVNTARSLQSATCRAMIKIKNIDPREMQRDSDEVKQSKANLESIDAMNKVLNAAKKLHIMQSTRIHCMEQFSSTIHSTIDLGRARGHTNENYFGQYLKMMASTMHSVKQIYTQYNENFSKHVIEAMRLWQNDEDIINDIQNCVNLKFEYNKIRNSFNSNSNSKNRLDLEDIETRFVSSTNKLIKKREQTLIAHLDAFEQCLSDYAQKKAQYIESKRLINGYDEMKQNKSKVQNQIQNEMMNIHQSEEWSEEWSECDDDNSAKLFSIIFFHRNKFPPSTTFLTDCVAPLCSKYIDIRFIIVHHTCCELLDKYNISVFPTCLVFEGLQVCHKYGAIIGNSSITREELQYRCKQLSQIENHQ